MGKRRRQVKTRREGERERRTPGHTLKQQASDRARRVKVLNGCDYPLTRVHRTTYAHKHKRTNEWTNTQIKTNANCEKVAVTLVITSSSSHHPHQCHAAVHADQFLFRVVLFGRCFQRPNDSATLFYWFSFRMRWASDRERGGESTLLIW